MFKFCWHKWYVIEKYTDNTIESMARDPHYDPDLDDYIGPTKYLKEKVCIKCRKYVDEITPRYLYHLKKRREFLDKTAKARLIVAKVKKGRKRVWER